MQCSNVSAKIKGGSTASDVIVTDPKNTGEECTFALANRQLPLLAPPFIKRVEMVIPESLLLALTDLFQDNGVRASLCPLVQVDGYQINARTWSCYLAESPSESWFFRPFGANAANAKPYRPELKTDRTGWVIDERISDEVRKSFQGSIIAPTLKNNLCSIYVISNEKFGAVLSVPCTSLQLVATMLNTWGIPPESVVRDWQNQLDSFSKSSPLPSTAETLVTFDGTLIPLGDFIEKTETELYKSSPVHARNLSKSTPFSCRSPDWPKRFANLDLPISTHPDSSQKVLALSESTSPIDLELQPKSAGDRAFSFNLETNLKTSNTTSNKHQSSRKKNPKLFVAGIVAATITCLASSIWLLNLGHKPMAEHSVKDQFQLETDSKDFPSSGSSTHQGPNLDETNDSDLATIISTSDPIDTFSNPTSIQPELTVDSLLSQLRPNKGSPISLSSVTASSIISEALAPTGTEMPSSSQEDSPIVDGQVADATEAADLIPVLSERGIISLERPLKLQAAKGKETVAVGAFVLTKACRCEIEIKLSENVVVEPLEIVTIEGIGKASWKIAIEDEDPELIVEIASKPGARWQLLSSVWLREVRGAVPILIGPRQAQYVGNRLVDYRQLINASLETLRNARSNSRGRFNIDFPGEIKKLERQEREAEKAIDRWKVIARLSHYFFDSNEIRIQMTAIEKPPLK